MNSEKIKQRIENLFFRAGANNNFQEPDEKIIRYQCEDIPEKIMDAIEKVESIFGPCFVVASKKQEEWGSL